MSPPAAALCGHSPFPLPPSSHTLHRRRRQLPGLRYPHPADRLMTRLTDSSSTRRLVFLSINPPLVRCKVDSIEEGDFREQVLRSQLPVLVEFVAAWCGPCRLVAPAVEWASQEYEEKLKIVKIDHDASPKLIEEYKVYGLPTLILFRNGQEIPESRREGAITKVKLKAYLDAQLEAINAR